MACGVVNKIMFIPIENASLKMKEEKRMLLFGGEFLFCFRLGFLFIRGWMNDFILPLTHVMHHDALCAFFSI